MIAKALRTLLAIALLPAVLGFSTAFAQQLIQMRKIESAEILFLLGVTAYLAFHALVAQPSRAYVFGHEMTHAAATWISGGQVKGFKAGSKKGAVTTNRITAFITLAPYLVPIYALLWAAGYGVAGLFWDTRPWAALFFFGLGATLTFHLVFTVSVLKEKQSDLDLLGPLLSLVLIVLANVTLLTAVMSLVVREVRLIPYFTDGFRHSKEIYQAIFRQLF